jgi:dual specificity MAP kinase phosphatase
MLKSLLRRVVRAIDLLRARLVSQGIRTTALWAADHAVRIATGAPIQSLSQITPQLHVGGQYRRRGWPRLAERGVTAVINMRIEYDDNHGGIAPETYLHLPTVDDAAPTLAQLGQGVDFIRQEVDRGGSVYVHCASGVGRAPALAAAYFVSIGLGPDAAWDRIRAVRPFVRPTPPQIEQIQRFATHSMSD